MYRRCFLGVAVGLLLTATPAPAQMPPSIYLGKRMQDWAGDLRAKDPAVRRTAAFALGKIGKNGTDSVRRPKDEDDAQGRTNEKKDLEHVFKNAGYMLPNLKKALDDADDSVREAAAFAVADVCNGTGIDGQAGLVATLTRLLSEDKNMLVRRSAAVALGSLGAAAKESQAALDKALADGQPAVRQNAAWALGRIEPSGVDALRKLLRYTGDPKTDEDPTVIRDAAKSLALLDAKVAKPALNDLLELVKRHHPDAEVRKAVVAALVPIVSKDDQAAYGPLSTALDEKTEPEVEVRRNAALALGNMGGEAAKAAVPVLVDALLQKVDPDLRTQAAAVLKNIGPDALPALEPLRKVLHDPDPTLRRNAVIALGGLKDKAEPAYNDILALVTDAKEDAAVRSQAAVTLSQIGKVAAADEKAIRALIGVLQDRTADPKVRERILWALPPVQGKNLDNYPEFFKALEETLPEERTDKNRMLRYQSAYYLGMYRRSNVPKRALDVLNEFLKDDTVQLYAGVGGKAKGTGEKGSGRTKAKEEGASDGRVMVTQALKVIGKEVVTARRDIMTQLRALADAAETDARLRKDARELLDAFAQ
jgi:HEAT repeat protein